MLSESLQSWSDSSGSASTNEGDAISVPSNFRRYTIKNQTIKLQTPQRVKPQQQGESYDGMKDAKQVDLAIPGEELRPVYIATDLLQKRRKDFLQLFESTKTSLHGVIKILRGWIHQSANILYP